MDWEALYGFVDVASTSLSMPVAITGFWIAIAQIRKTTRAAEAAREAASNARADARRAGILILLPQLQRAEEQIDRAIDGRSVDLLIAWANTWRWQASQLNMYLQRERVTSTTLPPLLQASVLAAARIKQGLDNTSQIAWSRTTKRLSDAVTAVTNELGGLAVEYVELPDRSTP